MSLEKIVRRCTNLKTQEEKDGFQRDYQRAYNQFVMEHPVRSGLRLSYITKRILDYLYSYGYTVNQEEFEKLTKNEKYPNQF